MKNLLPSLLIIGLTAGLARGQTGQGSGLGVANPSPPAMVGNSAGLNGATASVVNSGAGVATIDPRFQLPVDPTTAPLPSGDKPIDGAELLVQRVTAALAQHRSISARVRYRVDLFGHQLVGEGIYLQQGAGDNLQLRLELKTVVGDRVTAFQQVCDGRFLWQYEDTPEKLSAEASQKPQITRIDVYRARQALAKQNADLGPRQILPVPTALPFGGLPKLVDGFKKSFIFSRVEADRLDPMPVWVATGAWRPEAVSGLSKDLADQAAAGQPFDLQKLPPQLPEVVRLCVGEDDLFPYRIEYLRRAAKQGRGGEGGELLPIVTVEFYEVRLDSPIAPANFVYQPGNADVLDTTQSFIKQRVTTSN